MISTARPRVRAEASGRYGSARAGLVPGSWSGIRCSAGTSGYQRPTEAPFETPEAGVSTAGRACGAAKSKAEVRSPATVRRQALMSGALIPSQVSRKRTVELWSNVWEQT